MSRQKKGYRNNKLAKQFSALRKSGQKGPAKTKKLHTKVNVWYRDRDAYYRRNEKGAKATSK